MLAVRDRPNYDASRGQAIGVPLPVTWVDVDEPDPPAAETNPAAVFEQGFAKGGARFSHLEGCWHGDGGVYFQSTNGGDAGLGQVWRLRTVDGSEGELLCVFESPGADVLDGPDNITVSPRGGILICEDGGGEQYLRGLTPDGRIFDFAKNLLKDREFAGACFDPAGATLFVNIQGDMSPLGPGDLSMTFAIWGPWENGAL